MKVTFGQVQLFVMLWKRAKLTDEDLRQIENEIMTAPVAAPVIGATGGVRKKRFAPASRDGGKSGGFRVCYVFVPEFEYVGRIMLYPKTVQENLSPEQKRACMSLVESIKSELRKGERRG